jgi:hypothetical protein
MKPSCPWPDVCMWVLLSQVRSFGNPLGATAACANMLLENEPAGKYFIAGALGFFFPMGTPPVPTDAGMCAALIPCGSEISVLIGMAGTHSPCG